MSFSAQRDVLRYRSGPLGTSFGTFVFFLSFSFKFASVPKHWPRYETSARSCFSCRFLSSSSGLGAEVLASVGCVDAAFLRFSSSLLLPVPRCRSVGLGRGFDAPLLLGFARVLASLLSPPKRRSPSPLLFFTSPLRYRGLGVGRRLRHRFQRLHLALGLLILARFLAHFFSSQKLWFLH